MSRRIKIVAKNRLWDFGEISMTKLSSKTILHNEILLTFESVCDGDIGEFFNQDNVNVVNLSQKLGYLSIDILIRKPYKQSIESLINQQIQKVQRRIGAKISELEKIGYKVENKAEVLSENNSELRFLITSVNQQIVNRWGFLSLFNANWRDKSLKEDFKGISLNILEKYDGESKCRVVKKIFLSKYEINNDFSEDLEIIAYFLRYFDLNMCKKDANIEQKIKKYIKMCKK